MDAVTRQPLPSVPVWYALESIVERPRFLGLIPTIEPDLGSKLALGEAGETDGRGEFARRGRALFLPGNQRVGKEFVFVNMGVEVSQRTSRIVLEELAIQSDDLQTKSDAVPPGIYVAWRLSHAELKERVAVFRNPCTEYRGVLLVAVPGEPYEGYRDWTKPEDRFRVQFKFRSEQRTEQALVVELERYRDGEGRGGGSSPSEAGLAE